MSCRSLTVAAALLLVSTAVGQRNLRDIPPPDPEIERKSFVLPEGFEVNLFAADPRIAKPIQMNFDAAGRLWIASSRSYPHLTPGAKPEDQVLVVEDTDGDGTSDRTTVFAEGLLMPTGLLPGDGGVYVANSTEMLFLKDTDGDGKADHERVMLSGFGTEDTHHILHTFRWAPAGFLTFNQSIYIHSHIETPHGVRRLNAGGMWWFRPETMRLEVGWRGLVNPWGNAWTDKGTLFATDGAGGEGLNFVIPGAYYRTAYGAKRILPGLNPGSPKYCGLEMVDGRHLPDDWQGDFITHDFRGNRVCRFKVEKSGSGYVSRQQPDVITSKHVAFRPIDVKMGPDGAIYIADWYNPIIQHGEVDFQDERRDRVHGRIWRITMKDRPLVERPNLVEAPVRELLDQLSGPETWTRRFARRVLAERGWEKVGPVLRDWVVDIQPDAPTAERDLLNALWVANGCGRRDGELLMRCLGANDDEVRASAVRLYGRWLAENGAADAELPNLPLQMLNSAVHSGSARVRLEAVRAMAHVDDPRAIELATRVLEYPMDPFLEYALWLLAYETRDRWVPRLAAGELDFDGNANRLTFALRAAESPSVAPALLKLLDANPGSNPTSIAAAKLLVSIGGTHELGRVYDLAAREDTSPADRAVLLRGLATASRTRKASPRHRSTGAFHERFEDPMTRLAVIELAGAWRDADARDRLAATIEDARAPFDQRRAAVSALAEIGGKDAGDRLAAVVSGDAAPVLKAAAAGGLVRIAPARAANVAAGLLTTLDARTDPTPLFAAFLARPGAPAMLAARLEGTKLNADVARLGLRAVTASGRPNPELAEALRTAGNVTTGVRRLTDDEMDALLSRVSEQGDASRGEGIFRRDDLNCLKCHAIGGAGGRVGPDLVSLGASAPADYVVQSLLDPNAKVKENYHTVSVVTDEGRVHSGIVVRRSDAELVLRDAEDREVVIPKASIEDQSDGVSIMPVGLVDRLTEAEFVDLVRYLTELGREGPYKVGRERVARVWQVMRSTPEAAFRLRRTSYDSATGDDPAYAWDRRYATVSGALPAADLPGITVRNRSAPGSRGVAFARTEFDVSTAGRVVLALGDPAGLQLWLDDEPLEPGESMSIEVTPGRHRLTFAVDLTVRRTALRVELTEGRASFVIGK